jgi:hypothetical protein
MVAAVTTASCEGPVARAKCSYKRSCGECIEAAEATLRRSAAGYARGLECWWSTCGCPIRRHVPAVYAPKTPAGALSKPIAQQLTVACSSGSSDRTSECGIQQIGRALFWLWILDSLREPCELMSSFEQQILAGCGEYHSETERTFV